MRGSDPLRRSLAPGVLESVNTAWGGYPFLDPACDNADIPHSEGETHPPASPGPWHPLTPSAPLLLAPACPLFLHLVPCLHPPPPVPFPAGLCPPRFRLGTWLARSRRG